MAFWSNFDFVLDVAICQAKSRSPSENYAALAVLTTGQKKGVLIEALREHERAKRNALEEVFSAIDRNGWVHSTILNPKGDFSELSRLRIKKGKNTGDISVTNEPIDLAISPFDEFYPSYEKFMQVFAITGSNAMITFVPSKAHKANLRLNSLLRWTLGNNKVERKEPIGRQR